ncbi:MAG: hypothetical protein JW934_16900 [Anaerolineae bacterium]|nr:hypothetical protein [Anaerolineae bacterium]
MSEQAQKPKFEIGLVMAGAVSAGAYTAGVIDFLLQALDAWYGAAGDLFPDGNPHEVKIKVMSGASAGGMTAALAASVAAHELQPVTQVPPAGPVHNKLYECWVDRIDISHLLQDRDLARAGSPVVSVLDGSVLDDIANYAFSEDGSRRQRPYFDDALHVLLSVTNLRGVPYGIRFDGGAGGRHELSLHADYMHFIVDSGGAQDETPGALRLDAHDLDGPGWAALKEAALASGAFPIGLPPRVLQRRHTDYDARTWSVPMTSQPTAEGAIQQLVKAAIPPRWPPDMAAASAVAESAAASSAAATMSEAAADYAFLSVDGGLMDNEPLELARSVLAQGGSNPREGAAASQAVIMVDPFPDVVPFSSYYKPNPSLISVAAQMFSGLRHQAMFKLDELALAYASDVYSRFLIAPSRATEGRQPTLACGSLGAFGGFFSRRFRQHDFRLGRRNCQRFLVKYFRLPENNPLFAGWGDDLRAKYRIEENGQTFLPIIPLLGDLQEPEELLPWPRIPRAEVSALGEQIQHRLDVLLRRLLPSGSLVKFAAQLAWYLRLRRVALEKVMAYILADFEENDLLQPAPEQQG